MHDLDQQTILLLLGATTVLGLLLGLLIGPRVGSARKATRSLQEVQDEHASYKRDVSDHFEKSAQLFASLTQDYRELYRHLAEGSERLADGESENLALSGQSLPVLPTAAVAGAGAAAAGADPVPGPDDAAVAVDTVSASDAMAETESDGDVPPVAATDMDSQLRMAAETLASDDAAEGGETATAAAESQKS